MKIRENFYFENTTLANLKPYDMFVLNYPSPNKVYMYIMTVNRGPKYLELIDGHWQDSNVAFSIHEPISIIKVETLEYKKV